MHNISLFLGFFIGECMILYSYSKKKKKIINMEILRYEILIFEKIFEKGVSEFCTITFSLN